MVGIKVRRGGSVVKVKGGYLSNIIPFILISRANKINGKNAPSPPSNFLSLLETSYAFANCNTVRPLPSFSISILAMNTPLYAPKNSLTALILSPSLPSPFHSIYPSIRGCYSKPFQTVSFMSFPWKERGDELGEISMRRDR